eukprot:scaffold5435_cov78-Skeletonema_dohrnii-CCMP3373.AAC.1
MQRERLQHAQMQQAQMQQAQLQQQQAHMQQTWANMSPQERQIAMTQWYASVGYQMHGYPPIVSKHPLEICGVVVETHYLLNGQLQSSSAGAGHQTGLYVAVVVLGSNITLAIRLSIGVSDQPIPSAFDTKHLQQQYSWPPLAAALLVRLITVLVYSRLFSPKTITIPILHGYNGDFIKAQFDEDSINKQKELTVTVRNTVARQNSGQEILRHWRGTLHFRLPDDAMEADKDDRLEHASRLKEVLPILDKLQRNTRMITQSSKALSLKYCCERKGNNIEQTGQSRPW